jgi:Pyridine nucleotide-disulphide oxidoreductase
VIATGAWPGVLPGLEPDGERVWTYFEAMTPKRIPESLLVVGVGAIGVEFASFYSGLGAKVAMIEALPQILPAEDDEISRLARARFERRGISIRTNAGMRTPSLPHTEGLPRLSRAAGPRKSWRRMQLSSPRASREIPRILALKTWASGLIAVLSRRMAAVEQAFPACMR